AAAWASRGAHAEQPAWARWLVLPSVVGAAIGVALLRWLPSQSFDAVVPWLILLAAMLFALQPQVARMLAGRTQPAREPAVVTVSAGRLVATGLLQLLVAIYGGYFGAGIGILMLAVLPLLGPGDIHALNAVKNLLATVINGVATALFAAAAIGGGFEVSWPHVAALAVGAVTGGVAVVYLARRLAPQVVRRVVSLIAFALAGYYFWREWSG
ncbi:MAG: sulfite exporter TauE/SafE family protein, partial [Planctomycetota bacterium]